MAEILNLLPVLLPILFLLVIIFIFLKSSIVIAKGNEIVVLERRWFGNPMPDGRTVALKNEIGIQARILGPGLHFLTPFIYKNTKHKILVIKENEVGLVRAITGKPMPIGTIISQTVECDLFQDGELFLTNGGEKGPQTLYLPEGEYKINPHLFEIQVTDMVDIGEDEIGIIESYAGEQVKRQGGNFGSPVACNNFQDANAFLQNGGQKGPQIDFLLPGTYRINKLMFNVKITKVTVIPGGTIGTVEAMDGERISDGFLLGKKVIGHRNYFDGEAFLKNGGQRGRQLEHLMPGKYRINTSLFKISQPVPWTNINADEIGIVTINEGKPILDPKNIAAEELPLNIHNHFQDASAFIMAGGEKGLQIPFLKAGNYAINPWFASVEKKEMININIGTCGVVTSFVGQEGEDVSNKTINAKIVANGCKGIWSVPLQPGKHPINTKICKVDIVPTTQISLNWANNRTEAHDLDTNLKTIVLRTKDAFSVSMDVCVIIHIPLENAAVVIAILGSLKNMISQVLEPAISSHFRNAAQKTEALDLYTARAELQATAKVHIQSILKEYGIDSKDTLISDVFLPEVLTKPVTDRQIAAQEKQTFIIQQQAEKERREYENAKAQADMQPVVVQSERQVEIEQNKAQSIIKQAEGAAKKVTIEADAKSEAVEKIAKGNAEATKLEASAKAQAISDVGRAEAEIILAKGTSTAEAYDKQAKAMGLENFTQLQVIDKISNSKLKLIPDVLIGGGGNNNYMDGYFGTGLYEKLSGKKITESVPKETTEK